MEKTFDVIVVGAGAIGASCGYELTKAGLRVLVVDKKDSCMGTGGATGGLLSWFTKKPGYHLELFLKSRRLFEPLEEEIGSFGLYEEGTLQVIENETELELVQKSMERDDMPPGFSLEILDQQEFLKLEPYLNPELPGALWIPQSGRMEVFDFIYALVRAAKNRGCQFLTETAVTGLVTEGDRVTGVETPHGTFYADTVVNACGVWGGQLAKMLGYDMPIRPRRGQMVAMEQRARFVNHMITSSMYQTIKFHPELITDEAIQRLGYSFGIEQTDSGTAILSCTREFAGFDTGVTLEAVGKIIAGAAKVYPCLKDMNAIRIFSGLRPYTPDGLPIVGPLGDYRGFCMACGHEGDGIALAPITAQIVKELIVDGGTEIEIGPMSWKRFAQ